MMEAYVKQILSLGATTLIVLFISSSAMATGVGVYGEFQRGMTRSRTSFNISSDDIGVSGGLVVDTNVAKNDLFNYRLRLGAGQTWASKKPTTRLSLVQSFGVSPAPLRGDFGRFWFGPRIGLHYINAKTTNSSDSQMMMIMTIMTGFPMLLPEDKIIVNSFKADIGLVVAGFNFNFGPLVTLSFELGFDYGFTVGKAQYESSDSKMDVSGEGIEGFATMAVLFRINDSYSGKSSGADMAAPEKQDKKMQIQIQQ
jgi:hypothetical protein